jgi:hypothetical protein
MRCGARHAVCFFQPTTDKECSMNKQGAGGQPASQRGVVTAEDPATGEPDPAQLKEAAEQDSRGRPALKEQLLRQDDDKRKAARQGQRPEDAAP